MFTVCNKKNDAGVLKLPNRLSVLCETLCLHFNGLFPGEPGLAGFVIRGRHVRPSVGDIWLHTCVLPFTVTSSFHGLAWPAMSLAVSPSRVQ